MAPGLLPVKIPGYQDTRIPGYQDTRVLFARPVFLSARKIELALVVTMGDF